MTTDPLSESDLEARKLLRTRLNIAGVLLVFLFYVFIVNPPNDFLTSHARLNRTLGLNLNATREREGYRREILSHLPVGTSKDRCMKWLREKHLHKIHVNTGPKRLRAGQYQVHVDIPGVNFSLSYGFPAYYNFIMFFSEDDDTLQDVAVRAVLHVM